MNNSRERATELYNRGFAAFRAGDNKRAMKLIRQSLEIGRELGDQEVVGQALIGLCRTALRAEDPIQLRRYTRDLDQIAEQTGQDSLRLASLHMRAEMARIEEDFDLAGELYDESMQLSEELGRERMVATECFNKSFVLLAQDQLSEARELLKRHFEIHFGLDEGSTPPYGLIGVANLLRKEGDPEGAAEATFACRRFFRESDTVPDPADEKPLSEVEAYCRVSLPSEKLEEIEAKADESTYRELVDKLL
ncbi:MAG: hypothetical protein R3191_03810 [Anaerolineales bacterium]|nr:hypothetical protein [Anaerolineales bacterium]